MANNLLAGVRVIDLSRLLPGPYCTLLLADLGADVIKIEPPVVGDYARRIPDHFGGREMVEAVNRGKKSIALDYRNPRGRELLYRLLADADVMMETFRPGAVKRWKLDYDAVRSANDSLVYCSLSGYGQEGPYRDRAGHDINYLAIGGLLGLNGAGGGPPIPPAVQISDMAGGMLATVAILAALWRKARSGEGAYLDVSMLDSVISWLAPLSGMIPGPAAGLRGHLPLAGHLPSYNVYETSDGRFISVGALEPHFWAGFCQVVERPDLANRGLDPAAVPDVAAVFRTATLDEWLGRFANCDVCVEPVLDPIAAFSHPQVQARGLAEAPDASGALPRANPAFRFEGAAAPRPAPQHGEHTREVLEGAGLSAAEIDDLVAAKAIRL